jgi:hypothetical protein
MAERVGGWLCFAVALVCACGKSAAEPAPSIGSVVQFAPQPQVDPATLPGPIVDGVLLLIDTPRAQVGWKRPDPGPLTAAAACSGWITSCVGPGRSLDDCARSAPTCATGQPWNEPACCPADCFARYSTARLSGTKDAAAFLAVYLDDTGTCIPGLAPLVRGTP